MQNSTLSTLKDNLNIIAELIIDKNDVFYIDIPFYFNVGDLLIYHGTERYFEQNGITPKLRACILSFDLEKAKQLITEKTTIICQGGGNFGDIYTNHQNIRETIIRHFPNNRVIVLPQTVFFEGDMTKSINIFTQHLDCHLFARDRESAELLKHFSKHVYLCPDMAHQLYADFPYRDVTIQNKKILYFLRTDIEKTEIEEKITSILPENASIKDWDTLLPRKYYHSLRYKLIKRLLKLSKKTNSTFLSKIAHKMWLNYTKEIIHYVISEFLKYDEVITSRLHAHILSCLLHLPNQVCNNSYGKNYNYFYQWTKDIPFCKQYQQ